MTNEKEIDSELTVQELADSIIGEVSYAYDFDALRNRITTALGTVRAEEREAAFKEIRARVEAVNPHLTFGSANGSMMKKCILAEIEATENRKGEG